ncbi:MAG: hypothetical protein P4L82_15565 [Ancalomicrobiaceae bacterium]|nr:hypothetical protein [Ancalomicrobiaceae bacterium]
MAKGQKHSNKEARKPKAAKPTVAPVKVGSFLERAGTSAIVAPKKKP